MCECSCGGNHSHSHDALIPMIGVITDIRTETPDVKTFRVVGRDGKKQEIDPPAADELYKVV